MIKFDQMNAEETANAAVKSLVQFLSDFVVVGITPDGITVVVSHVGTEAAAQRINELLPYAAVESAKKECIWQGFTLEKITELMKQLNVTRFSCVDTDGGYLVKDLSTGQYIPAPGP